MEPDGSLRAVAGFALRHPAQALRALVLLARLPRIEARLTDTPAGRAIAGPRRRRVIGIGGWRPASAVLALPETVGEYYRGKARQALRTNLTNARKAGVVCRSVDDRAEQHALLEALATSRGQSGLPDWLQRHFGEEAVEYSVAEDRDGRMVGLCAAIVDEEVALLAYHASVPDHPLRSEGRWLLTARLIEESIERGAKLVLVESGPLTLSEGLVYFQRRIGFGVYNLRLRGRR